MSSGLSDLQKKVKSPTSWKEVSVSELRKIRGVCLDIDETLSTDGKLTAEAFTALWDLKKAGFIVVPITGRPAGWCDHIARFWPVDAVIGENGAFTFYMKNGVRKRLDTPVGMNDWALHLAELGQKVQRKFPRVQMASDQAYREHDLAIDICEDVEPWPAQEVEELLHFCKNAGAHAKLSSIHVNVWFGDYDKRRGFEHWIAQGAPGLSGELPQADQWLYIGDSPNDESMFQSFPHSVGVANLKKYLDRLSYPPTWITENSSGKGFAEMAMKLVKSRESV